MIQTQWMDATQAATRDTQTTWFWWGARHENGGAQWMTARWQKRMAARETKQTLPVVTRRWMLMGDDRWRAPNRAALGRRRQQRSGGLQREQLGVLGAPSPCEPDGGRGDLRRWSNRRRGLAGEGGRRHGGSTRVHSNEGPSVMCGLEDVAAGVRLTAAVPGGSGSGADWRQWGGQWQQPAGVIPIPPVAVIWAQHQQCHRLPSDWRPAPIHHCQCQFPHQIWLNPSQYLTNAWWVLILSISSFVSRRLRTNPHPNR